MEITTMVDGEEKRWLHDVSQCISSPVNMVKQCGGRVQGEIRETSLRKAINIALRFCFLSEVQVNGRIYKQWHPLRTAIKEELVKDHLGLLSSISGLKSDEASGGEIADAIIDVLNKDDDGHVARTDPVEFAKESCAELEGILTTEHASAAVQFWTHNNLTLAPEFCAAYQELSRQVLPAIANATTGDTPPDFQCVAKIVLGLSFDVVPHFLRQVASVATRKLVSYVPDQHLLLFLPAYTS